MSSIYIVEDEFIIALNIKKQLKDLQYDCIGHSASAEEALPEIEQHRPDLVLMDIELGHGMNGIKAANIIREQFDIPVVFLTAYADEQTLEAATIAQPFGYIVKPFNSKELNSSIKMALYQKQIKDELKLRDKQLSGVLSAINEPLIVCDRDGQLIFYNDNAEQLFGLKGLHYFYFDDYLVRKTIHGREIFSPLSNSNIFLEFQKVMISTHNIDQQVYFFRNITELIDNSNKLMHNQKQLHESQKIEALGRLAGGVAHDFNNYLAVILGYIKILMEDVPGHSDIYTSLKEIEMTTKKAAGLTKQLLTLARNHKGSVTSVNLNTLFKDNIQILSKVLPKTVKLQFTNAKADLHAYVDPELLLTAILNLIINARDAINGSGEIQLRLYIDTISDSRNCNTGILQQGTYTCVQVKDSGKGIPHAIQNTIFEPFFTTKELGNGLGLSNLYSLILQWGGHIELKSEPGNGAEFILYLSQNEVSQSKKLENTDIAGNGYKNRILLVEPDPQLQKFYTDTIRKHGCEINICNNAGEAFLLFDENPLDYCLLITDIIMPRISGLMLAEKLKIKSPQIKVLFTSSYSLDELADIISLPDDINILQKNCSEEELINKLHSLEAPSLLH